jgi:hypothetical protein
MKELTSQQEKFCRLVAEGASQASAYREAYPKSQKWKENSVMCESSKLMRHTHISHRVNVLKEELNRKSLWTREEAVNILKSLLHDDSCRKNDIINAIKELNKMHGFEEAKKLDVTSAGESLAPQKIIIVAKESDE